MSWSSENDNCAHLRTEQNCSHTRNRINGCGESNNNEMGLAEALSFAYRLLKYARIESHWDCKK